MSKTIVAAAVCAATTLVGAAVSSAQHVDARTFDQPAFQFNLSPPGARSLALGASFIGLADDATAAESNPAGLTILTRPEVSGQLRLSSFHNEFPNTATSEGFATFDDSVTSPSFFSVVYPRPRFAVSGYYQRAADFKSSSRFEATFNLQLPGGSPIDVSDVETTSSVFRVTNVGLSAAYKVSPRLSLGATVRHTTLDLESFAQVAFAYPRFAGFSDTFEIASRASDHSLTFNAGLLFTPSSRLSVGAVFKKGATFVLPTTASAVSVVPGSVEREEGADEIALTLPDAFGAGLALHLSDRFTLLADVVRINYSNLANGHSIFAEFGEGGPEEIQDGTELHLGAEYTFNAGRNRVVAVRAGGYTDPDHDGLAGVRSGQVHLTFGAGLVLGTAVQIDGALNLAKRVDEALLSFVLRF
jgi:long-chain fatty acid transport protein